MCFNSTFFVLFKSCTADIGCLFTVARLAILFSGPPKHCFLDHPKLDASVKSSPSQTRWTPAGIEPATFQLRDTNPVTEPPCHPAIVHTCVKIKIIVINSSNRLIEILCFRSCRVYIENAYNKK
jgi:hypothetical protein